MKLAIVGGRDFSDYAFLEGVLALHFPTRNLTIISGGAVGADSLGEEFAMSNNLPKNIFKPEWNKYSKSAGFRRNQTIVDNCDMVLAFWDGYSRGTADTIEKAKRAKKPTFIVYY